MFWGRGEGRGRERGRAIRTNDASFLSSVLSDFCPFSLKRRRMNSVRYSVVALKGAWNNFIGFSEFAWNFLEDEFK